LSVKLVPPGSSRLRRFQEHFARALVDPAPPNDCGAGVARLLGQPGFAVYRNTVLKGAIDALQANYPAVTRLVGEEWMRAAAAVFARANPPASPMLLEYGERFADFLQGFEPAAELPYLADVARLDRFWNEAHGARDELPVGADLIASLTQDELARASLRPHAAARWAWFDEQPIFTIWSRNRSESGASDDLVWQGEGALLTRPLDAVQSIALGRAGCAFLDACAAGGPLSDAALAALAVDPAADLAQLMARLLASGAFGRLDFDPST
jgi:hypothetical protein